MKIFRKRLAVVFMALIVLLSGVFAMVGVHTEKAQALSPAYQPELHPQTVYYFTDYYNVAPLYDGLEDILMNRNSIIDFQYVNTQEFTSMVYDGYFTGFCYGTAIVVIDLKIAKPDAQVLYDLFYSLKQDQGCVTAFVTSTRYDSNESFINLLDIYLGDGEWNRLNIFLSGVFKHLGVKNGRFDYTAIFMDPNLLSCINQDYLEKHRYIEIPYLLEHAPIVKFLAKQIMSEIMHRAPSPNIDYEELVYTLSHVYSVKILLKLDWYDNVYIDVLSSEFFVYDSDFEEFRNRIQGGYLCAIGFWNLEENFYNFLYDLKINQNIDIPVYVLEVDPISFSANGLGVITDYPLDQAYEPFECYVAANLLNGIRKFLID